MLLTACSEACAWLAAGRNGVRTEAGNCWASGGELSGLGRGNALGVSVWIVSVESGVWSRVGR